MVKYICLTPTSRYWKIQTSGFLFCFFLFRHAKNNDPFCGFNHFNNTLSSKPSELIYFFSREAVVSRNVPILFLLTRFENHRVRVRLQTLGRLTGHWFDTGMKQIHPLCWALLHLLIWDALSRFFKLLSLLLRRVSCILSIVEFRLTKQLK